MPNSKKAAMPQILTEFTLFPKFPREIRDIIWAKSIPGSHIVEVYVVERELCESEGLYSYDSSYDIHGSYKVSYEIRAAYKIPVMLQVCPGSRRVALKLYTKIFENHFGERPVYLNAALDTLHLRDGNVFEHLYNMHRHALWTIQQLINNMGASTRPPIVPQLRRLQIGIDIAWPWAWDMKMALKAFGSPELVVLTVLKQTGNSTNTPHFKYLQKKLQKIDQEINGNHNDEYKPEVLVLSTLQLKEMIEKIDNPRPSKLAKASKITDTVTTT